jgi:hypothetical protein
MGAIGALWAIRVEHVPTICVLAAALPFMAAGLFAISWNRDRSTALLVITGALLLTLVVILNCAAPVVASRDSTKEQLLLADARGYASLPILAMHGDDRTAQFYGSGRVIYGSNGEVMALDEAREIIDSVRKRREKILAFVPVGDLELFKGKQGIEVIGDNGNLALLCLY